MTSNIILYTDSSKKLLNKLLTSGINVNVIIDQLKDNLKINKKKLVKISDIWRVIWLNNEHVSKLLDEILTLPVYIPKINNAWYMNIKQINTYINYFKINIDPDVKKIIANLLYLVIHYMHETYGGNADREIEQQVITLLGIGYSIKKKHIALQEIMLRSLLLEMNLSVSCSHTKFCYFDFIPFLQNINDENLKKMIEMAFICYKKIIIEENQKLSCVS